MMSAERFVAIDGPDRIDALAFLARAIRLDDAAVVRLATRADGMLGLWARTGFDVLAGRAVIGTIAPADLVCDASGLRAALAAARDGVAVDPGFGVDSAWRGALPGATGFRHVDDVPARRIVELSRDGARVAREEGSAHGPATGLLDQEVLTVDSDEQTRASITMRSLFALTGMGFIRDTDNRAVTETSDLNRIDPAEPVRIRVSPAWVRIDARFGSVFQRRRRDLGMLVG
ncbi:MAG: hypothetical protein QM662_12120 [Gordonia sp. (in: high G+C Gram-positive bacteria)]